jgi:DNA polymerase V
VDCNNLYVSCERVFRPGLEGRPVVLLLNNDGCIIARSDEAKPLGFAMGDPYHLHRDTLTCHGVAVCSSNYALYGDMSRRVMDTLSTFCPEIELYSIDEAILNLTGFERRGLAAYAQGIRATVRRDTGIPVSIGIGPTKTLAKVANHVANTAPDAGGVYDLTTAGDVDRVLAGIEVREVWGVEPRWATWLEAQGIVTALDLKHADPKAIRRNMTVVGERLVDELNGRPCLPLERVTPLR